MNERRRRKDASEISERFLIALLFRGTAVVSSSDESVICTSVPLRGNKMALKNAHLLSVSVDLGGTSLRIAAYTPGGGVLDSLLLRTRLEAGPTAVVEDMCNGIRRLLDQHSEEHVFAGIGVGSPGPLELPAGRLRHPPNLPGWDGFPLLAEMENRLQRSIIRESDANAAALAEYELGLGKELEIDSMCMLTLGTWALATGSFWMGRSGTDRLAWVAKPVT